MNFVRNSDQRKKRKREKGSEKKREKKRQKFINNNYEIRDDPNPQLKKKKIPDLFRFPRETMVFDYKPNVDDNIYKIQEGSLYVFFETMINYNDKEDDELAFVANKRIGWFHKDTKKLFNNNIDFLCECCNFEPFKLLKEYEKMFNNKDKNIEFLSGLKKDSYEIDHAFHYIKIYIVTKINKKGG